MSDNYSAFDDEDQAPAEKPATTRRSSTAAAAAPAAAGVQTVTMTVAALIGVVALLLGVIIGIVIPVNATPGGATSPSGSVTPENVAAPQLSPEQMQSGDLPPGHPDLSGMQGSQGSTETTGN